MWELPVAVASRIGAQVNRRVQEYSPAGAVLAVWGGRHQPLFVDPSGIALDVTGKMYVLDQGRNRVLTLTRPQRR